MKVTKERVQEIFDRLSEFPSAPEETRTIYGYALPTAEKIAELEALLETERSVNDDRGGRIVTLEKKVQELADVVTETTGLLAEISKAVRAESVDEDPGPGLLDQISSGGGLIAVSDLERIGNVLRGFER